MVKTIRSRECSGNGSSTDCAPAPAKVHAPKKQDLAKIARFADMLTAMGTEPRLRIVQLLLTAHPEGLVVGDIMGALEIAPSTLSHHLEKLRHEGVVTVRRDKKFLWYTTNIDALQDLLTFLFSECCGRTKAIRPETLMQLCK